MNGLILSRTIEAKNIPIAPSQNTKSVVVVNILMGIAS